jgi:hypothetical protein
MYRWTFVTVQARLLSAESPSLSGENDPLRPPLNH